jgi:PadR family transcriptional regulator PadR
MIAPSPAARTPTGRAALDELAAQIRAIWQLHATFVTIYENTHSAPAPLSAGAAAEPSTTPDTASAPHQQPADGQRAACSSSAARAGVARHVSRRLLAAWLLLALERDASYGYELRRALARYEVHSDPPALYRTLRKLEQAQWLRSRWLTPTDGPRQRLYRVTAKGRRNLAELTRLIMAERDTYAALVYAYDSPPASKPDSLG